MNRKDLKNLVKKLDEVMCTMDKMGSTEEYLNLLEENRKAGGTRRYSINYTNEMERVFSQYYNTYAQIQAMRLTDDDYLRSLHYLGKRDYIYEAITIED
tara:strand:+ start:1160 stop:1456 length:297 start_codon:yes stop_codon:yes gene_type:complete